MVECYMIVALNLRWRWSISYFCCCGCVWGIAVICVSVLNRNIWECGIGCVLIYCCGGVLLNGFCAMLRCAVGGG